MTEGKIMVEREPYEKDGKTYQSYFIKGTVRGVDFRVRIVPPLVCSVVYASVRTSTLASAAPPARHIPRPRGCAAAGWPYPERTKRRAE